MIPVFRAKDEKGVWHVGLLTFMFRQYAIVNESDENTVYLIDKETIEQHVGACDVDGEKIWSGNIVEDAEGTLFEVRYNDFCSFMLYQKNGEYMAFYPGIKLKVVGDVHDAPTVSKLH